MKRADVDVGSLFMSNAFTVFSLPVCFNIDLQELEKRYLKAQQMVHPDTFVGRSEMEKRVAAMRTVTLNEAYQRLKNLISRAQEFLNAKNVPIPGQQGTTVPTSPFLVQVLEWRERIQGKDDLLGLKTELSHRLDQCKNQFDRVDCQDLATCYLNLTYTLKTLEELEFVLKENADTTC